MTASVHGEARAAEARRQQALLHALTGADAPTTVLALREHGERAARGLQAYRANSEAIAERALAAAFPTVQAMVGDDDFARLARDFRQAHPPERGDLAEWGDAFADWLQSHAAMAPWPYLGDCARLDWALHCAERAEDAALDTASLALLGTTDPARLRLVLVPGTALLRSPWPIVAIHRAHRLSGADARAAFGAVRNAIAAAELRPRGEVALVVRSGWRGVVHRLDVTDARWTACLLAGTDLATALDAAGDAFDFAAWLAAAVRESWLKGAVAMGDEASPDTDAAAANPASR